MDLSLVTTTASSVDQDQDQEPVNNLVNLVPIEKEHMFDKVVTPSDVGKLNRLVIPKQHAEKYFPLDASSSSCQNGMLLNFQDRNGKMWRFRYSYWNSSQSYVMTKGWSRFVKDKKLDAGDVVSFQRGVGEFGKAMLFIDWRHRPDINILQSSSQFGIQRLAGNYSYNFNSFNNFPTSVHSSRVNNVYLPEYSVPISRSLNFGVHNSYHQHQYYRQEGKIIGYGYGSIVGRCCHTGSPLDQNIPVRSEPLVIDSVPVVTGRINPAVVAPPVAGKRLRLFGVNMECDMEDHNSPARADESNWVCGDVPRGEMGALCSSSSSSSSSYSTLQLNLSSDDDQFAKKGKSSLSFGLDP